MTVSEFRASGPKVLERRPRRRSNLPGARGFSSELPDERILERQIGIDSGRNGTLTSPPPAAEPAWPHPPDIVLRTLEIVGLDTVIPCHPTLRDTLSA